MHVLDRGGSSPERIRGVLEGGENTGIENTTLNSLKRVDAGVGTSFWWGEGRGG